MKASSLLEPQQFGSWLHEPFLARASEPGAEHGRHALGAFLTLRLADRFRPDEEPSHPLALAYQVRATRDYLLDLHPQNAEVSHLLEVVRVADAVQKGSSLSMLWPPVLAYAHWLEQELQLVEALDVVETALGLNDGTAPSDEVAALLQRARILRLLGRFEEARTAYHAGRDKAKGMGDVHSELLGRIGEAIVMRQVGNLKGSEKALREILVAAEQVDDRDAQARARHDLGSALVAMGRAREGVLHFYQAFELYEQDSNRQRALSDVGEALKQEGQYDAARDAFELVLAARPSPQTQATTMIALLELSALTKNRVAFARWSKAIATLSDELPAERQVDLELQLGVGHATFGQRLKAERHLRRALSEAEHHHLNEYMFRAEQALKVAERTPGPEGADAAAPSGLAQSEQFAEVASKLHAMRTG